VGCELVSSGSGAVGHVGCGLYKAQHPDLQSLLRIRGVVDKNAPSWPLVLGLV